ncbi:hypothetical protein KIPB_004014, partial [Kipferlia bialata]|eukprot:g4014.t1
MSSPILFTVSPSPLMPRGILLLASLCALLVCAHASMVPYDSEYFQVVGRYVESTHEVAFDWPGSKVVVSFTNATDIAVHLQDSENTWHYTVSSGQCGSEVDGVLYGDRTNY